MYEKCSRFTHTWGGKPDIQHKSSKRVAWSFYCVEKRNFKSIPATTTNVWKFEHEKIQTQKLIIEKKNDISIFVSWNTNQKIA